MCGGGENNDGWDIHIIHIGCRGWATKAPPSSLNVHEDGSRSRRNIVPLSFRISIITNRKRLRIAEPFKRNESDIICKQNLGRVRRLMGILFVKWRYSGNLLPLIIYSNFLHYCLLRINYFLDKSVFKR